MRKNQTRKEELAKYPDHTVCPFCGRLMNGLALEVCNGRIQWFWELNWDRKGGFYYISSRRHCPFTCKAKR